jgi:urease accessory protein
MRTGRRRNDIHYHEGAGMLRAVTVERAGTWSGTCADRVELDFDNRHRRRITMRGEGGLALLLDLEEPARLRHGDALVLEDGRRVAVAAAAEPLSEIRCRDVHHLVRLAWHLGNRHLPTMIDGKRLLIRRDHVIEDMARGLGAAVVHVEAPFEPEGGAYAGGGHSHHNDPHDGHH